MNSTVHTTDSQAMRRLIREELARFKETSESEDRAAEDRQIRNAASAERPISWE